MRFESSPRILLNEKTNPVTKGAILRPLGGIMPRNRTVAQISLILPMFPIDPSFFYIYHSTHLANLAQSTIFAITAVGRGSFNRSGWLVFSVAGGLNVQCCVNDGTQRQR
jgi:hypothetical protein